MEIIHTKVSPSPGTENHPYDGCGCKRLIIIPRICLFFFSIFFSCMTFNFPHYNGLVLPHLDYADTVWGHQPGLKSEMEKLQSFQNKFARKIKLSKMSSSEALKCLNWLPLAGARLSHQCTIVDNAIKGNILQHFESFQSTLKSSHGYNTRNGYLPRLLKTKLECGKRVSYLFYKWLDVPPSIFKKANAMHNF